MLVCNVSLKARRAAIAADLEEAALALDASTQGQIIFATLVDDPASVSDTVDAYSGEIMLEAASAADTFDAGMVYAVAIDEGASAADMQSVYAPVTWAADVAEAASAFASQDAIGAATVFPIISASRAGVGSVVASAGGSGKTQVVSNVGAVT